MIGQQVCPVCGIRRAGGGLCASCAESRPHFKAARSWAEYREPLRGAIHQLKYKGNVALGECFSDPLIGLIDQTGWRIGLIVPVPLGIARLAARGYNQAKLLAQPIAWKFGLPLKTKALVRVKETLSQVDLNAEERKINVSDAFEARREIVARRSILLVDDVMTSGATLDACAKACLEAGAGDVYAITLARASGNTHHRLLAGSQLPPESLMN